MGKIAKAVGSVTLAALAFGLLADDAEARRRSRPHLGAGIPHGGKRDPNALSREELRFCLVQQRTVELLSDEVDARDQKIEHEKSLLNRRNAHEVEAFNAAVLDFNQFSREADAEVSVFKEQCAGKLYYESDLAAITNPAAAAMKQEATAPSMPPSTWVGWAIGGGIVLVIIGLLRRSSRAQPLKAQITPKERVLPPPIPTTPEDRVNALRDQMRSKGLS